MYCSHMQVRAKRRLEGEQGGSVLKRLRWDEGQSRRLGLEERKVRVLERIADQLERLGKWMERMEGEARLGNDLAVVTYLCDTAFESVNWVLRDRLAEIATWSGELDIERRWREDQDRGEGSSKRARIEIDWIFLGKQKNETESIREAETE